MKFLIVDDDDDLRDIMSMVISSNYDINIYQAFDGENAIEVMNSDGPFDLVLCDYNMPRKNGAEVYLELRKLNQQTPFILISTEFERFKKQVGQEKYCDWIDKPFKETDITNKIEALMGTKGLPPQKQSYLPIRIETLEQLEMAGVPLYLKLNQSQYIKVLKETSVFDKSEMIRFQNKKVSHLQIELVDMKTFISNFRKNVFSKIDWKNVDCTDALKAVEADWDILLNATRGLGWSESLTVLAKENIARTITLIGQNPQLKKHLEKFNLSRSKSFNTPHCYALTLLTSSILKELNWDSPSTIQKMTFACLLHDMDLNDLMFSNMLELITSKKIQTEISQQSNYLIFNHMSTAAEFMQRWSSCPPDVDTLILQHHERFDGTGFPNKLTFLNIFPLAGVFIMAEDLIYGYFNHPEKNMREILKENENLYSRGDFKKVYLAVEKVIHELT
jgi:two-component system, chemotaxis family, chemotaxis protein CheY